MNQATTLSPPIFSPNFSTSNDAMDDLNNRWDRILDKYFDRIIERMEKRLAERSSAALSQASTVDELAVGCDNSVSRVPATTTTEIPSTTTINQVTTLSPPIFSPNFSTSNNAMDDLNNRLDRILDKCFDRIFERMEKRLAERSNAALSQASTVDELTVGCDNSVGRVLATTTTESTELLDASSERVSLVASEADHGIDAGGLAAPTPTTCSTECQSRDTTASTSAFTLDTTRTSAAAIVDVVHVLAAPAASDGTLDGDTISGAASTPTTCSTGGTVGDDPGTVFLIPRSVAASFTEPPELSRAQLGLDNLAPVACSMKCLVDTNATPSRLLQAAAPALIHKLKVLRPLPWPSFKYSQVSTLWQLENFMNHTKVPSVGIIVQKNNCSKHLVSQAVGRCIFMIRHMWLFPADELFFGGPEIILSAPQFVSSEMQQRPAVCQLIICNEFLETTPTTMKSEVIQGNLSNHSSGIIMNDLCNLRAMRCLDHVFLRRKKLWSNIQCSQLGDANFEASFWPERHIIGSCLASPGHKFSVAIVWEWLYTHILNGQFQEVGNQLTRKCRAQSWLGNILVQIATIQTGANCCFRGTSNQVEKLCCCYWGSDQEMFSYGRVGCRSEANDKEEMAYYICDITYEFYWETLDLVGSLWKTYNFRFNWVSLVGLVQCHNTFLGDVLSAPKLILCMSIKYRTKQKFEGSHSLLAAMELSICTIHKGVLQTVENFRELKSPTTTENNDPNNSVISVSTPHINSITELKEYWDSGGLDLQFSFNAMAILQGHWCFGIVNNLWIPPGPNGKYFLYAHCWVLKVCQASSQGLIKESSTWYWYMVFVYHKVQRPGVPMIAWPVCVALMWTTSERCWATCLHCLEPHQWLSMLPAGVSRIWLVAWPMDGVELSIHREHPPFQGGRSVTLLATHIDHNYYLDDDSSFDFIHDHLNHGHYRDDYHGDSDMIKDLQAPWDPGDFFVATAWGQADFQGGRGVSDLP